jgi:dTDP-4-dehydrorhamnose reductase
MKVLVLGHKGMLGHMVSKLLTSKNIEVTTTECRWSTSCFKNTIKDFDGDYIINCIGAIHQRMKLALPVICWSRQAALSPISITLLTG